MVDQQQQQPLWEQIGSSFVHHYYKVFDSDRAQLESIYVSATDSCIWYEIIFYRARIHVIYLFCFNECNTNLKSSLVPARLVVWMKLNC